MNTQSRKMLTAVVCLLVVSALGFSTVYGYGGTSGGPGRTGTRGTPRSAGSQGSVLGAAARAFNANFGQGGAGDDVRELQERLRALGYFTFPTSTGYFGPITFAAVQAFQRANGIPATGFVGPLTRAALNK
jgi:peptidoglycan hydrolase-like protein with peptidoglycan-binding domain